MVRNFVSLASIILLLTSCSSIKPLNFTSNKQVMAAANTPEITSTSNKKNTSVKFIDDISVTPAAAIGSPVVAPEKKQEAVTVQSRSIKVEETTPAPTPNMFGDRSSAIENASSLQIKYSILLNTEVEQLQNTVLLGQLDEWYGTRYRMGGMTKSGVDCSAFVQAVFAGAFGLTLPRTAREQYRVSRRISRTELQEGDLLFFNTRGGVSHVGIYLQNNKFIHASTSKGVTISDMFEPYYLQRFVGAGRMDEGQQEVSSSH